MIKKLLDLRSCYFEARNIGYRTVGNLKDVFHPQARHESIQLTSEQDYEGERWVEEAEALVPHIHVTGSRPKMLGLGTKRFEVTVFAKTNPPTCLSHKNKRELLERLAHYLIN